MHGSPDRRSFDQVAAGSCDFRVALAPSSTGGPAGILRVVAWAVRPVASPQSSPSTESPHRHHSQCHFALDDDHQVAISFHSIESCSTLSPMLCIYSLRMVIPLFKLLPEIDLCTSLSGLAGSIMADKEATVYIVDIGRSMAHNRNGRKASDLEWAMQYVWDKITTTVTLIPPLVMCHTSVLCSSLHVPKDCDGP